MPLQDLEPTPGGPQDAVVNSMAQALAPILGRTVSQVITSLLAPTLSNSMGNPMGNIGMTSGFGHYYGSQPYEAQAQIQQAGINAKQRGNEQLIGNIVQMLGPQFQGAESTIASGMSFMQGLGLPMPNLQGGNPTDLSDAIGEALPRLQSLNPRKLGGEQTTWEWLTRAERRPNVYNHGATGQDGEDYFNAIYRNMVDDRGAVNQEYARGFDMREVGEMVKEMSRQGAYNPFANKDVPTDRQIADQTGDMIKLMESMKEGFGDRNTGVHELIDLMQDMFGNDSLVRMGADKMRRVVDEMNATRIQLGMSKRELQEFVQKGSQLGAQFGHRQEVSAEATQYGLSRVQEERQRKQDEKRNGTYNPYEERNRISDDEIFTRASTNFHYGMQSREAQGIGALQSAVNIAEKKGVGETGFFENVVNLWGWNAGDEYRQKKAAGAKVAAIKEYLQNPDAPGAIENLRNAGIADPADLENTMKEMGLTPAEAQKARNDYQTGLNEVLDKNPTMLSTLTGSGDYNDAMSYLEDQRSNRNSELYDKGQTMEYTAGLSEDEIKILLQEEDPEARVRKWRQMTGNEEGAGWFWNDKVYGETGAAVTDELLALENARDAFFKANGMNADDALSSAAKGVNALNTKRQGGTGRAISRLRQRAAAEGDTEAGALAAAAAVTLGNVAGAVSKGGNLHEKGGFWDQDMERGMTSTEGGFKAGVAGSEEAQRLLSEMGFDDEDAASSGYEVVGMANQHRKLGAGIAALNEKWWLTSDEKQQREAMERRQKELELRYRNVLGGTGTLEDQYDRVSQLDNLIEDDVVPKERLPADRAAAVASGKKTKTAMEQLDDLARRRREGNMAATLDKSRVDVYTALRDESSEADSVRDRARGRDAARAELAEGIVTDEDIAKARENSAGFLSGSIGSNLTEEQLDAYLKSEALGLVESDASRADELDKHVARKQRQLVKSMGQQEEDLRRQADMGGDVVDEDPNELLRQLAADKQQAQEAALGGRITDRRGRTIDRATGAVVTEEAPVADSSNKLADVVTSLSSAADSLQQLATTATTATEPVEMGAPGVTHDSGELVAVGPAIFGGDTGRGDKHFDVEMRLRRRGA